jgi:hypothetical protein
MIVTANPTPLKTDNVLPKISPPKSGGLNLSKDVPIFLRKTYHMVDSSDPEVVSWSDDGLTFVVKKPDIFESKIIPQFFKHSKFSSFVRQLNFYGFRKLKYSDTIIIDTQLELETANFWRFHHEKFIRGRPELLVDIKRAKAEKPSPVKEEKIELQQQPESKQEDVKLLKTEVDTLRDRIEKMTSNIDQLTSLVQNFTIKEQEQKTKDASKINVKVEFGDAPMVPEYMTSNNSSTMTGIKRKKVESTNSLIDKKEDVLTSSLSISQDLDEIDFSPETMFPITSSRQTSTSTCAPLISDDIFVDELFNDFDESEMDICTDPEPILSSALPDLVPSETITPLKANESHPQQQQNGNAPDPALMKKLSDALTILPKEMQETLVNKLIATITSSEALQKHLDSIFASSSTTASNDRSDNTKTSERRSSVPVSADSSQDISLPLAIATLSGLISQYSASMKNKSHVSTKSLPIIPIHA